MVLLEMHQHVFPFDTLNNQNFSLFVLTKKKKNTNTGSSINLKPFPNFSLFFKQFSDLLSDSINKNPENLTNCKYYDIDDIQTIKTKLNTLSIPSKYMLSQQKF